MKTRSERLEAIRSARSNETKSRMERLYGRQSAERERQRVLQNLADHQHQQIVKETTMPNGTVKLPKDAEEQRKLVERQANNINRAKSLKAKFEQTKAKIAAERDSVLATLSPKARAKVEAELADDYEAKLADARAELADELAALRDEVNQIGSAIKETADYLANPISVANAHMIGSPRRDSIARSLEGAGPKKIADLYRTALITEDSELGSEVIAALERTDKKYRPFPVWDAALALFGSKVAGVKDNARMAEVQLATIHETLAEVEGVKPLSTVEKMGLSLRNPGMGRLNPDADINDDGSITSTDKISAGLAARSAA